MELTVATPHHGPEETVIHRESRQELMEMVDALAPGYRLPVVLHYWYDFSYAEISEIMEISVQAVKSRLHRARLHLARFASGQAPIPAVSEAR